MPFGLGMSKMLVCGFEEFCSNFAGVLKIVHSISNGFPTCLTRTFISVSAIHTGMHLDREWGLSVSCGMPSDNHTRKTVVFIFVQMLPFRAPLVCAGFSIVQVIWQRKDRK